MQLVWEIFLKAGRIRNSTTFAVRAEKRDRQIQSSYSMAIWCCVFPALLFIQLLIDLLTGSVVNVCIIYKDFLFVSIVTIWVSLKEVCLPIFVRSQSYYQYTIYYSPYSRELCLYNIYYPIYAVHTITVDAPVNLEHHTYYTIWGVHHWYNMQTRYIANSSRVGETTYGNDVKRIFAHHAKQLLNALLIHRRILNQSGLHYV